MGPTSCAGAPNGAASRMSSSRSLGGLGHLARRALKRPQKVVLSGFEPCAEILAAIWRSKQLLAACVLYQGL